MCKVYIVKSSHLFDVCWILLQISLYKFVELDKCAQLELLDINILVTNIAAESENLPNNLHRHFLCICITRFTKNFLLHTYKVQQTQVASKNNNNGISIE